MNNNALFFVMPALLLAVSYEAYAKVKRCLYLCLNYGRNVILKTSFFSYLLKQSINPT